MKYTGIYWEIFKRSLILTLVLKYQAYEIVFEVYFIRNMSCFAVVGLTYYWVHKPLLPSHSASGEEIISFELVVESGDSAQIIGKKLDLKNWTR